MKSFSGRLIKGIMIIFGVNDWNSENCIYVKMQSGGYGIIHCGQHRETLLKPMTQIQIFPFRDGNMDISSMDSW